MAAESHLQPRDGGDDSDGGGMNDGAEAKRRGMEAELVSLRQLSEALAGEAEASKAMVAGLQHQVILLSGFKLAQNGRSTLLALGPIGHLMHDSTGSRHSPGLDHILHDSALLSCPSPRSQRSGGSCQFKRLPTAPRRKRQKT